MNGRQGDRVPSVMTRIRPWLRRMLVRMPVSDRLFIQLMFWNKNRRWLNLDNPRTLMEKINWLRLNHDFRRFAPLADKYAVREHVGKTIGQQYLNKIYGEYQDAEEILYTDLPERFVLKATHGSEMNYFCWDKRTEDLNQLRQICRSWLLQNFYWEARDPVYLDITPRIICEAMLSESPVNSIVDYKFFCYDGNPMCIQVDFDRHIAHKQNFYDLAWRLQPYRMSFPPHPEPVPKPATLEEMIQVAKLLSAGLPFVRIDLYSVRDRVLFGEYTFIPSSGYPWIRYTDDLALGQWLKVN